MPAGHACAWGAILRPPRQGRTGWSSCSPQPRCAWRVSRCRRCPRRASPMPRALRSKTSWPDPTARITSQFRHRQRMAAFAWRSPRDPCWRALRKVKSPSRGSCPSRSWRLQPRTGPGAHAIPMLRGSSAVPTAALFRSTRRRPTARCRRSWPWRWRRPVVPGSAPSCVRVDAPFAASSLSRWQRETGVDFRPGSPWRWEAAPPAAYADAVDLLPAMRALRAVAHESGGGSCPRTRPCRGGAPHPCRCHRRRMTSLRYPTWRTEREWIGIAAEAGVPPDAATSPATARAALARRYEALRHGQGLPAPDDALPLLARAMPALVVLPAGAVKSASYADGHWTLDLGRPDVATIADLDARLRAEGVPALVAASATGTRVRFGGP